MTTADTSGRGRLGIMAPLVAQIGIAYDLNPVRRRFGPSKSQKFVSIRSAFGDKR